MSLNVPAAGAKSKDPKIAIVSAAVYTQGGCGVAEVDHEAIGDPTPPTDYASCWMVEGSGGAEQHAALSHGLGLGLGCVLKLDVHLTAGLGQIEADHRDQRQRPDRRQHHHQPHPAADPKLTAPLKVLVNPRSHAGMVDPRAATGESRRRLAAFLCAGLRIQPWRGL